MKHIKATIFLLLACLILVSCGQQTDKQGNESSKNGETSSIIDPVTEKIANPETPQKITVNGEAVEIAGAQLLKQGDSVQDTELILPTGTFDTMQKVNLLTYKGWKIIHSVPSLDTPVCSYQTRLLNDVAGSEEFNDIEFFTISADTPFALHHFSENNEIKNLVLLSDFQGNNFAKNNKLYLPEYMLSTRAILIVDENNVVQYIEYAPEVTEEISVANIINYLRQNHVNKI